MRLKPNQAKIVAAIHHALLGAQKRGQRPGQYQLVKTLFLADRSHLNRFGRPITFDNYIAMNHGPVPSMAYDLLKRSPDEAGAERPALPWRRHRDAASPSKYLYEPLPFDGADHLSVSDQECLDDGLSFVLGLGFGQLRKLTHEDIAYIRAWGDGTQQGVPMDLALMFETHDPEAAEQIAFASEHA